ncbi:hypothetical protein FHT00_001132 [Sphingomonas insulae]|uniref:Uncharacterized protein n=1 Tax=Sphingomonas insulae TaxID=424800 RepID=A0ABP3SWP9_9SPHN|nr:hypothetical protein [Sphingomonas insulae]NIJ29199.1 hypothetical protein [Sphingomonas insulae]
MSFRRLGLSVAIAAALISVPAIAGNKLIPAGTRIAVAKSTLTVQPASEWNKLGARPGRNAETWTLDGDALNDLTFYGGIDAGKPLFREADRKNRPLPTVSATMLITDIPALLESSYRIALGTAAMSIGTVEPVTFAGGKGVRFTYAFTRQGETLHRRGEGRGAMIGGRLYLITYEAPALYYFDRSVAAARQVADSARL